MSNWVVPEAVSSLATWLAEAAELLDGTLPLSNWSGPRGGGIGKGDLREHRPGRCFRPTRASRESRMPEAGASGPAFALEHDGSD